MRRFALFLLVFFVLCAGLFGYAWHLQSSAMLAQVERAIADMNKNGEVVSYDSISRSGFPAAVQVTLVNPRAKGRLDQWLAQAQAASPTTLDTLPPWETSIEVKGELQLHSDLLGEKLGFALTGPLHYTNVIAGMSESSTSQPEGSTRCDMTLGFKQGRMERLVALLKGQGNASLEEAQLRALECRVPAMRYVDDASNELLTSTGGLSLDVSHDEKDSAHRHLRVVAKGVDMEVTAAGDRQIESYLRALAPGYVYSNRLASYGKQNFDLDFEYEEPHGMSTADAKSPLAVHVHRWNVDSAIYGSQGSFHFTHTPGAEGVAMQLKLQASSHFGEGYDALLRDLLRDVVRDMYANPDPNLPQASAILARFTPDTLYEAALPVLPKLHTLGKLTQEVQASYNGNQQLTQGKLALEKLDIGADAYGIAAQGSATMAPGQLMPAGNVTLDCRQCPALLDDTQAYWQRVTDAMQQIDPATAQGMALDPAMVAGFKQFLQALAKPMDSGTYRYELVGDGGMGLTINGKRMDEVLSLYAQHMGAGGAAAGEAAP
jgi:hypothetical protein